MENNEGRLNRLGTERVAVKKIIEILLLERVAKTRHCYANIASLPEKLSSVYDTVFM